MTEVTANNAGEKAVAMKNGRPADPGPGTVRRSATLTALAPAMVKVQAAVEDPKKSKAVDAGARQYKYATLETVLDAIRPACHENGLAFMQFPCDLDGDAALCTLLTHASGEWLESTVRMRPVKADPQSVGSAISYYRRYSLLAVFGLAQADDDGAASSRPPARQQAAPPSDSGIVNAHLAKIAAATNRDEASAAYTLYDADVKAGRLTDAGRAHLDEQFKALGKRFPKPAATPAK